MDPLIEAYLGIYNEENRGEVYLNMSPEEKQKRRNIRWADNTHGITPDNTIMIRDKDTANLVNKMRVSRHKKSPSLEKERTQGTVRNKYLHRQQDKKELRNKLEKLFSVAENIEYILDILVSEGFAVDYEGAECILEAMSDEWVDCILDEKYVKKTDLKGKGPDHRAIRLNPDDRPVRLKKMPGEFKYWEAGFNKDASRRSPSARERKAQRRQGVGGFNA
jgi:hypothetical protein